MGWFSKKKWPKKKFGGIYCQTIWLDSIYRHGITVELFGSTVTPLFKKKLPKKKFGGIYCQTIWLDSIYRHGITVELFGSTVTPLFQKKIAKKKIWRYILSNHLA